LDISLAVNPARWFLESQNRETLEAQVDDTRVSRNADAPICLAIMQMLRMKPKKNVRVWSSQVRKEGNKAVPGYHKSEKMIGSQQSDPQAEKSEHCRPPAQLRRG